MSSSASIFWSFLKMGCTSFGGPIAHLGFFREEFVERKKWLSDQELTKTIALCQLLPGPTSSQVAYCIGLHKGGMSGGLRAWLAFSLPSFIIMLMAGIGLTLFTPDGHTWWLNALKICAVVVVAKALIDMAPKLCPSRVHGGLALLALIVSLLLPSAWTQVALVLLGGLFGLFFFREKDSSPAIIASTPSTRGKKAIWFLASFAIGLIGLKLLSLLGDNAFTDMPYALYRSGALVFGGGHVALPMLHSVTVEPGWISEENYLSGYGIAQALPGPLFSYAAFLGAQIFPAGWKIVGAIIALLAIYLPSFLLIHGLFPYWEKKQHSPLLKAALAGGNAVVLGILGAAFYDPLWIHAITQAENFCLAAILLAGVLYLKIPSWQVVLFSLLGGWILL